MKYLLILALALLIGIAGAVDIRPDQINNSLPFPAITMDSNANITMAGGYIKSLPDGLADGDALTVRQKYGLSVKAYGAVGDGLTNDYAAILSCIQAAEAAGLPVHVPAGTYYVPTQILIERPGFEIFGDGRYNTTFFSNSTNYIFKIGNESAAHGAKFSDLGFAGNGDRNASGIYFAKGAYEEVVRNCNFVNLSYAIYGSNPTSLMWSPKVQECLIKYCDNGIYYDVGVWQASVENCYIHDISDGYAISIGNNDYPTGAVNIEGCTIEFNTGDGGVQLKRCTGANVDGNYFEGNNNSALYLSSTSRAINIDGNYFYLGGYHGYAVNNNDATATIGPNNVFVAYGPAHYAITTGTWAETSLQSSYSSPNSTYLADTATGLTKYQTMYAAAHQADSTAGDVATLKTDFNNLLHALETTGVLLTS